MMVVLGGRIQLQMYSGLEWKSVCACPGDVLFWPCGAKWDEESVPRHPLRAISLYMKWPDAPEEMPAQVRDIHHVIQLLADRLLYMSRDQGEKMPTARLSAMYLNTILAEYISLANTAMCDIEALVIRYAETHMHLPVRLAQLARHTGLTVSHFSRRYKKLTGRSPMRDVQARKAAHAKMTLLQHPSWRLRDLLPHVGVKDTATLSRLLKRHTGVTACDIRRMSGR